MFERQSQPKLKTARNENYSNYHFILWLFHSKHLIGTHILWKFILCLVHAVWMAFPNCCRPAHEDTSMIFIDCVCVPVFLFFVLFNRTLLVLRSCSQWCAALMMYAVMRSSKRALKFVVNLCKYAFELWWSYACLHFLRHFSWFNGFH